MKIGIFGDSYAFHHDQWNTESWVSLLKKDFDVTSYGKNGSSTYYSYRLLKENYLKYDKIIFVITKGDRIHTSIAPVPTYDMAQYYLKKGNLTPQQRQVMQGLSDFILYTMSDTEVENQIMLLHLLLLKEIQQMGLDILFIRAFDDPRHSELSGPALWHITDMEHTAWGDQWKSFKNYPGFNFDKRQCHLTSQNNKILYEEIKKILPTLSGNTFFNFDISKFSQPDNINNYMPEELKGKFNA